MLHSFFFLPFKSLEKGVISMKVILLAVCSPFLVFKSEAFSFWMLMPGSSLGSGYLVAVLFTPDNSEKSSVLSTCRHAQ